MGCPPYNACLKGLSPRVRGNLLEVNGVTDCLGSIPACAGEPLSVSRGPGLLAVYPRVCGGTEFVRGQTNAEYGLSPRVRGNPAPLCEYAHNSRSIPACAGEPP